MTDDLGAGGDVTDGSTTQTTSETDDSTESTTETVHESDTTSETTSGEAGSDTITGKDAGTNAIASTDTSSSDYTGTLSEDLGDEGTVADGEEWDSLSNTSGETTAETDHPLQTVTDSALGMTRTLSETMTDTDTDNETDEDWACETLGLSATIASGSDCFTVNDLDTSTYTSSGAGPENYNDTATDPNGTATESGSGSSSQLTHQIFGDALGSGGVIATGSLSYTVSSSDSDAATTTDSGTETLANDATGGPSQTASYSITETTPDDDTAYETGTETLGAGGTISGGSASFSWSIGNSLGRTLAISGIAATLSIKETSTDTYGFGESGTESITAGGADVPGTVSFDWNQMGTDNYQIQQGNTLSTTASGSVGITSYSLNLTDSVSSSWNDTGVDNLTDGDEVVGETDTYSWDDFNSVTNSLTETETVSSSYSTLGTVVTVGTATYSGDGLECFSLTDSGTESLGFDETIPQSWTLGGETDQYEIQDSLANETESWGSWSDDTVSTNAVSGTNTYVGGNNYSTDVVGVDSLSGSASDSSDSYALTDFQFSVTAREAAGAGVAGWFGMTENSDYAFSADVEGTDSFGWDGDDQSTRNSDTDCLSLQWNQGSASWLYIDGFQNIQESVFSSESDTSSLSAWSSVSDEYSATYNNQVAGETLNVLDTETYTPYGGASSYYNSDNIAWMVDNLTWGNNSDGFQTSTYLSESSYTLVSGDGAGESEPVGEVTGLPESGTDSGLLDEIVDELSASYTSSKWILIARGVYSVPAYLLGSTPALGSVPMGGFLGSASGTKFGFIPSTNAMTGHGLPTEEASALGNMALNDGPNDGVSQTSTASPTSVLVTLAAAGRNPTDITIPTVGGEGSGGDGGGTSTDGSHLANPPSAPYWDGKQSSLDPGKWYLTYGDVFNSQADGGLIRLGPRLVDANVSTSILAPLPTIPRVRVATAAPEYSAYTYDDSDFSLRDSVYARRDLRANLMFYKVNLVNAIGQMLRTTSPVSDKGQVKLTDAEIEEIANRIADWYIRAVDEFLMNHPGAAPMQGSRNFWLDRFGIQDEFNHPWCDDWTTSLLDSSKKFLEETVSIGGKQIPLNQLVRTDRVQWHGGIPGWRLEHNFILVRPFGYEVANPPSSDSVIVLLDPWIKIAPAVYPPNRRSYPGTNTGIK